METYIIKSQKDLDKYKDDFGYHIEGNAEFEYPAEFTGRLLIDGYLYIKAGGYIEAGEFYGISAGLYIACKGTLSFGLKAYAGICTWKTIGDEEKTITCSKLIGRGKVEYGILKETGEKVGELTSEEKEALDLLRSKGFKLVKEK